MRIPVKKITIILPGIWSGLIGPLYCRADATQIISAAQWRQLTSDAAFSYKNDKEMVQPPKTLDPNALQKFLKAFFDFFGNGGGNILLWTVLICLALYVIYIVFFSKDSILFARNSRTVKNAAPSIDENDDITTTPWEILLQKAIDGNDPRLAVRYSYMWLLQMLQNRSMIQYRNDKTNYEYYTELKETSYRRAFKQLSRLYEYAWYGGFSLSADAYKEHMKLFEDIKKQLGA